MHQFSDTVFAEADRLHDEKNALQERLATLKAREMALRESLLSQARAGGEPSKYIALVFSDALGQVIDTELQLLDDLKTLASNPPALTREQKETLASALALNAVLFKAALHGTAFPIEDKEHQLLQETVWEYASMSTEAERNKKA